MQHEAVTLADALSTALWCGDQCIRPDILVRYLAVDHWAKTGELPQLYKKLSLIRLATLSQDPNASYSPRRFLDLLESVSACRGLNPAYPIAIAPDGRLLDGAHRLACAMYYDAPHVWIERQDRSASRLEWKWFEKHFEEDEVETLRALSEDLRERFVWQPLEAWAEELEYPPNHQYDVRTLKPKGLMAKRVVCLQSYAPELFRHGGTLLDIGSNKGFISLLLRDRFRQITGYEPRADWVRFANGVRQAHAVDNVEFRVGGLDDLPKDACADVVYAGHFNHHLYSRDRDYRFMVRLANCTKRVLIVDGPFDLEDATAGDIAEKGKWSNEQRDRFTLDEHAKAIAHQFDLTRTGPSGTGQRQIAVFTRR